jgi:hypothetical protein
LRLAARQVSVTAKLTTPGHHHTTPPYQAAAPKPDNLRPFLIQPDFIT